MSDGSMYYAFGHYYPDPAHRGRENKPIFMKRRGKIYGNVILLTTAKFVTPGYANDGDWEEIPRDCLLVVNCGEIVVCSDTI